MKIDIINMDDDLASVGLRSILEYWGCTVSMHPIATAKQLVRLLNGETSLSKHLVFMCHGIEQGLVLPDLAPEIAAQQPYQKVVSATDLQGFLSLPGCLVLNTGCLTGRPELAAAFLGAGCHTYIGPADYPEGTAALFYPIHFFYELHVRSTPAEIAHQKAADHNEETQMFQFYQQAV